jgi:hypothetical protein
MKMASSSYLTLDCGRGRLELRAFKKCTNKHLTFSTKARCAPKLFQLFSMFICCCGRMESAPEARAQGLKAEAYGFPCSFAFGYKLPNLNILLPQKRREIAMRLGHRIELALHL